MYFLGQSLNVRRLDAEVRLDEMKIGVLLQRPKGACQDIDAVTRTKQLFGEGFSDSGTTTCDDVVFHCVKMLGVMFAKAICNERLDGTCSLRINPFEGSTPSLGNSRTAVIPAAVMI